MREGGARLGSCELLLEVRPLPSYTYLGFRVQGVGSSLEKGAAPTACTRNSNRVSLPSVPELLNFKTLNPKPLSATKFKKPVYFAALQRRSSLHQSRLESLGMHPGM